MNQVQALKSAEECIGIYIAELEKRIAEARGYAPEQAIAKAFIEQFPETMPDDPTEYSSSRTRIGFSLDSGSVRALMINWDALTLAEIKAPLAWLAQRLGKYDIDDYPELGRRAYVFSKGRLRFQTFFNASPDAQVCKFVQVGVKEEPVYKLMCGDAEHEAAIGGQP